MHHLFARSCRHMNLITNHLQNFGFVVAFGALFISGLLLATELNTSTSARTSSILYKRGTTAHLLTNKAIDEEKGGSPEKTPVGEEDNVAEVEKALEATPKAHDVFTWQHLEYNVPVGGGEMRRLLDNVSGYVAPGKLTARKSSQSRLLSQQLDIVG